MINLDRIAGAIAAAGVLIALAIYMRPAIGRYEFSSRGAVIRRFDTVTGEALLCRPTRCIAVNSRGDRTEALGMTDATDEEPEQPDDPIGRQ